MMTPEELVRDVIAPGLSYLPPKMDTRLARLLLLAINFQEDPTQERYQIGGGPARGLWQFEQGGGVRGVMNHSASRGWTQTLCAVHDVPFMAPEIWGALAQKDTFAAGIARLLLWTDARPLPAADDVQGAWDYYFRNWRPGQPHRQRWGANHARARETMGYE